MILGRKYALKWYLEKFYKIWSKVHENTVFIYQLIRKSKKCAKGIIEVILKI